MSAPDQQLLEEAAQWLVQLQSGEIDDEALLAWRQRSPRHALAWQHVERLLGRLDALPGPFAQATWQRLGEQKLRRRQVLNRLGLIALAVPTAYATWRLEPWRSLAANLRTGVGEQRRLMLADGSQLVLNTDSALDVRFTERERRLLLRAGEILVRQGMTTPAAPFAWSRPMAW